VLQFNNGVTSAGVAATDELASQLRFSDGAEAWKRVVDLIPGIEGTVRRCPGIAAICAYAAHAFRSSEVAGERWALLPSAAGFVDPLLSTGIPLTLLGVSRLAEIIERDWGTQRFQRGTCKPTQRRPIANCGDCAPHRGALREHEQLPGVCRVDAALLCRGQLLGNRAKTREAATGYVISALR
jgi:hypothetical protein